jgi:hypothetical protein
MLWEWGLNGLIQDSELLVSELVTNAVKATAARGAEWGRGRERPFARTDRPGDMGTAGQRGRHPSPRLAVRDPASVSTHASPPGSYWYQIGTVSGPRSGPADTDKAAMCGSAKNSSRSCTDNLLSAMAKSLAHPPTNSPVALSPPAAITLSIRSTSEQRAAPRFVHALG